MGRGKGRVKQDLGACTLDSPEMFRTGIQIGLSKYGREPRGGGPLLGLTQTYLCIPTHTPHLLFCELHAAFASWKPQPLQCSHLSPSGIHARVGPVTSRSWPSPTGHMTAGTRSLTILVKHRLCNTPMQLLPWCFGHMKPDKSPFGFDFVWVEMRCCCCCLSAL